MHPAISQVLPGHVRRLTRPHGASPVWLLRLAGSCLLPHLPFPSSASPLQFPAAFFYSGRLRDAPAVLVQGADGGGRAAPWHARPCFPPLAFWDCKEASPVAGMRRAVWGCRAHVPAHAAVLQCSPSRLPALNLGLESLPAAAAHLLQGRERGGGAGSSVSNAEEAEVAYALWAGGLAA